MCNCTALSKAIDRYIAKADADLADELADAGFIDAEETVEEISSLERRIVEALKDQTLFFTQSISQAIDLEAFANDVWPGVKLTDDLADKLQQVFVEEFTEFMPDLINHYAAQIDLEIVVTELTQRTSSWIKDWSQELGDLMKLNSHNEIETILDKGLKEGQGVAEFTRTILDSGIRDEYYKARRVAVTEVLGAHSAAMEEAIIQSPAAEFKEWVHTGNYKNEPRWNHVDMNGTIIAKDQTFTLEGADGSTYYPHYPRDISLPAGERINCHCIHRPIPSEEILGLPIEERRRLQEEAIAADDELWKVELDARNRAKTGVDEV